jgi:hypothetical protein
MAIFPDFDSWAGWRQGGVDPGVVQMLPLHPFQFLLLVPDQRIKISKNCRRINIRHFNNARPFWNKCLFLSMVWLYPKL